MFPSTFLDIRAKVSGRSSRLKLFGYDGNTEKTELSNSQNYASVPIVIISDH